MITFKQFLTEARMAPLYHATREYNALSILEHDVLKPSRRSGKYDGKDIKQSISLTRSLKTAEQWVHGKRLILELDQNKLRNNYRIKPVNMVHVWAQTDATFSRDAEYYNKKSSKYEELFEEFVTEPIYPLSKYLTKIIISQPLYNDLHSVNPIIRDHPLLYYKGKFVNK